jgi:hypothetical protein
MSKVDEKVKLLVEEIKSFDTTIEILRNNRVARKDELMALLKNFIKETNMLKDVRFSGFVDVSRERMSFGTFHIRTHDKYDWKMGYDTVLRDVFGIFGHFGITVKLGEFKDTKSDKMSGFYLDIGEHDLTIEISPNISVEDFRRIQKEYGFKVILKNNEDWLKNAKERVDKYLYLNSLPIPD